MDRTQITTQLQSIRVDIEAAFVEIAKKHHLNQLSMGKITYSAQGDFHFKTEAVFAGSLSKEAQMYNMMQGFPNSGLPRLATEFVSGKDRYKITGMNSTRTKVHATNLTNQKEYLFPTASIVTVAQRQGLLQAPAGL